MSPLPNPGFEAGSDGWLLGDGVSRIEADAARGGSAGLRIGKDEYFPSGASVSSSRLPVTPGQTLTLSFHARAKVANAGAYLWYENAEGKNLANPPVCPLKASDGVEWIAHSKTFTVPEGAANVRIWIHSWAGAAGISDWDDFSLEGFPEGTEAMPPPQPRPKKKAPEPNATPDQIPRMENPPAILLKFDDVKPVPRGIHPRWTRIAEYLEKRGIPAGFGIICQGFEHDISDGAKKWFAARAAAGKISFWCHGWDHASHVCADGAKRNEFVGLTVAEARERLDRCQSVARNLLGHPFRTFGPTGGIYGPTVDAATLEALAAEPDFGIILYPQPMDDDGLRYKDDPALLVLDRVWAVNTEGAVGVPDFQRFLNGYAKNLSRPYFVLQAHPAAWDDARFAEFARILDFLEDRGTTFLTPEAYADRVRHP